MATSPDDFPDVWQKPAYQDLMSSLRSLRVEPRVWNNRVARSEILKELEASASAYRRRELLTYLSDVIKSDLTWIEDDDQKEEVWAEASRRLSERCGRTAMGEITRTWPFESEDYPTFTVTIREPPLTGDSLGLKTWGSSYLLAQMLHTFARGSLWHLLSTSPNLPQPRALELGAGTGLLGLAAAAVWQCAVTLTDLPDILPNLAHNIELNRAVIEGMGGRVFAGALTWGGYGEYKTDQFLFSEQHQFKIVLAADPLYDDEHPALLASAIDNQLAEDASARALVMVPKRDATTEGLLALFQKIMARSSHFECIEEGLISGQDDWGEDGEDEEARGVECWWGVFRGGEGRTARLAAAAATPKAVSATKDVNITTIAD